MKKQLIFVGAAAGLLASLLYVKRRTIPDGVIPVEDFDAERFLGKWYEIARINFRHERNLKNTMAEYEMNEDGTIKVTNSGVNYLTDEPEKAVGHAKFVDSPQTAMLKVSFFGPFYSGYNVIDIDEEYQNALVAGESYHYLWLLSREKTMSESTKRRFLKMAKAAGYDTHRLYWVTQE